MVKQVPYFEDSSGKAYKTAYDAWKADVALWLVETGAVNEASAKQLVEHITSGGRDRARELVHMLEEFGDTIPIPVIPATQYDDVVMGASR